MTTFLELPSRRGETDDNLAKNHIGGECWGGKRERGGRIESPGVETGATVSKVEARDSLTQEGTLKQRLSGEAASPRNALGQGAKQPV